MLKLTMVYTNKNGDEIYVLTGESDELYVFNRDNVTVSNWGLMDSLWDVLEDMDVEEYVYVKDVSEVKEWLLDNKEDLNCDVDAIVNQLIGM